MKLLSRFLLMVYSLLGMAIFLVGSLITVSHVAYAKSALYQMGTVLNWRFLQEPFIWVLVLLAFIGGFLINVYTFLIGLRGDRELRSVVQENSAGIIKISATTFENIALNVVYKLGGVKDAKAIIRLKNDKVAVTVRTVFLSDVNIPVLCEEAQKRIVQSIEQSTGVQTDGVKIVVEGVQNAYKGRVE